MNHTSIPLIRSIFARRRSNKRQYYFNIGTFLIKNKHIIVDEEYCLKVYYVGVFVESYDAFARRTGRKIENHYFRIPKRFADEGKIVIGKEYNLEVFYKSNS